MGLNIKRNNSEIKIFNGTGRKIDNLISYAILEIEEDGVYFSEKEDES